MDASQTSSFARATIARLQSNAQATNQIQSEEIHIFSKRTQALHFNPASIDTAVPRRDPFTGTKNFMGKGDSTLTDINEISFPTRKESGMTNDSIGDQSQRNNLISSEAKSVDKDTLQIKRSKLPQKLVGQTLFSGVSLGLVTAVIGLVVFQVILLEKVNQLESRSTRLENLILYGLNKTDTLENVVIPAIEANLSANINTTETLENIAIPDIQSNLSANIDLTNNIENVEIPAIQSDLAANIDTTNNIQNVVIPGIQSNISANTAEIANLETLIAKVPKFYYGITPTSAWTAYETAGIVQTVDISTYGFVNPPIVITSLAGLTAHWSTTGASSVYSITKNSFTVYIRWSDGRALATSDAVSYGWQLQYAVFSTD